MGRITDTNSEKHAASSDTHLHNFYGLLMGTRNLLDRSDSWCVPSRPQAIRAEFVEAIVGSIEALGNMSRLMHIPRTGEAFDRLREFVADFVENQPSQNTSIIFRTKVEELLSTMEEELRHSQLFYMSSDCKVYFGGHRDFGFVIDAIPELEYEIVEAGSCIALSRNTAAVFHLMRVCEHGLNLLWKYVGFDDVPRNWNFAIDQICKRKEEWVRAGRREDARQIESVLPMFETLKNVWRNPTMHVERVYSSSEAIEIHFATVNFMREIVRNF